MGISNLLNTEYKLGRQEIKYYRDKGHIKLENLVSKNEINLIQPDINKIVYEERMKTQSDYGKGKAFPEVINLWEYNKKIQEFIFSKRLAKVAADLMGVDAVRIYHDSALFTSPNSSEGTPWHIDKKFQMVETDHTITLWMPLIDLPSSIGSMKFLDKNEEVMNENISFMDLMRKNYKITSYPPLKAGDATFHSGWTLHYAPNNTSNVTREIITIIYYAANSKLRNPITESDRTHKQRLFSNIKPGDVAASKLNPILYSR